MSKNLYVDRFINKIIHKNKLKLIVKMRNVIENDCIRINFSKKNFFFKFNLKTKF